MTTMKEKLSASVRQAKATLNTAVNNAAPKPAQASALAAKAVSADKTPAQAVRKASARKPAVAKVAKPTAPISAATKPAASKAAAPKVTVSKSHAPMSKPAAKTVVGEIAQSSNQLFPERVWPD